MILKYFHYHVGSCVSKNTRGGDTIRLLIKLIVMINTSHLENSKMDLVHLGGLRSENTSHLELAMVRE